MKQTHLAKEKFLLRKWQFIFFLLFVLARWRTVSFWSEKERMNANANNNWRLRDRHELNLKIDGFKRLCIYNIRFIVSEQQMELILSRGEQNAEWNISFQIGWNVYQFFFRCCCCLLLEAMSLCSSFFLFSKEKAKTQFSSHVNKRHLEIFNAISIIFPFLSHFIFAVASILAFFTSCYAGNGLRVFLLTLARVCVYNRKIVISPSFNIKLIIKHSSCSRQCERIHQAHTHIKHTFHRFHWQHMHSNGIL